MDNLVDLSAIGGALVLTGAFLFYSWSGDYNDGRWEAQIRADRYKRMIDQQKNSQKARELRQEMDRLAALAKKNLRQKAKASKK